MTLLRSLPTQHYSLCACLERAVEITVVVAGLVWVRPALLPYLVGAFVYVRKTPKKEANNYQGCQSLQRRSYSNFRTVLSAQHPEAGATPLYLSVLNQHYQDSDILILD